MERVAASPKRHRAASLGCVKGVNLGQHQPAIISMSSPSSWLEGSLSGLSATMSEERSPHALQRTTTVRASFDRPTICVRWLPHFGQTGGGGCAGCRRCP